MRQSVKKNKGMYKGSIKNAIHPDSTVTPSTEKLIFINSQANKNMRKTKVKLPDARHAKHDSSIKKNEMTKLKRMLRKSVITDREIPHDKIIGSSLYKKLLREF